MDGLYVWCNMWYTGELTKLYAYNCGLTILQVVREKSLAELYTHTKDIRFHKFVNLTLIMYDFLIN